MDRNNRNSRRTDRDLYDRDDYVQRRFSDRRDGEHYRNNCLCTSQPISYAMAYVKEQMCEKTYPPKEAWSKGTLFPELYMPYCTGGCRR